MRPGRTFPNLDLIRVLHRPDFATASPDELRTGEPGLPDEAPQARSLVDRRGVEPLTLALQRRRSTTELPALASRLPWNGAPGRTRTADLTLIRRVL